MKWIAHQYLLTTKTNNPFLFIGKKGQVAIWDVRQHRQLHSFKAHDHPVKCLALDPNEDFFVTGSVDGDIKVNIWFLLRFKGKNPLFWKLKKKPVKVDLKLFFYYFFVFMTCLETIFSKRGHGCNQITVVAFQPVQLAQASFLQKNQMLQNGFLISITLRWHRVSVACKNRRFLSWLFHSSIIFGAKIEITGTKWVQKHLYIFFLLLV